MRTVLINTPAYQHIEDYDTPDYPCIGIGYLASYLASKGIAAKVIDSKLEKLDNNQTLKRLKELKPELVGISCMTHDFNEACKLATKIKQWDKNVMIVLGGIHATALPKETLEQNLCFDFLVFGEGEESLYELIQALKTDNNFENIHSLAFRKNNNVVVNKKRLFPMDLDKYPMPAWHLFPKVKTYHIITSRGCPYSCVFCMRPYGREHRERSPEKVLEELAHVIKTYKPREYRFNDETFGFNNERAMKILNGIIDRELHHIPKKASMRANNINLPLLRKMKEAGFVYIDLGIETGDPEILKKIKKGVTMEQTERAVRLIKQAGIRAGGNYIIGHPGETKETAKKTINYAIKLNCDFNAIGLMVPYPGTEIATMAKRGECNYKILSTDWKDYNKQFGNALELTTMSRRYMEWLQVTGYVKIYLYNFRYIELIKLLWHYKNGVLSLLKKMLFGTKPATI